MTPASLYAPKEQREGVSDYGVYQDNVYGRRPHGIMKTKQSEQKVSNITHVSKVNRNASTCVCVCVCVCVCLVM